MSDKNQFTDQYLLSVLRQKGFIIPKTEDEVDAFEKALKDQDIPPLPAELDDPEAVFKIPPLRHPPRLATEPDTTSLARAARDGSGIPQSVLDKMKKDRGNAEKED